jgi:hypothetical protein
MNDEPLTVERLNAIMDRLIRPDDPVEIRIGSPHLLADIPKAQASLAVHLHGLPVRVDHELPWSRIEVRARDGSTLVSIDRT